MRAYKFLDVHFGLKSLYERRLKQSRIAELNDPFELRPYNLTDDVIRATFLQTRDDMNKNKGMVCFSASWTNPVIWAHYADKHRGLCICFEIPEIVGDVEKDESRHVDYISELLQFPSKYVGLPLKERFAIVQKILFTKFAHWQYEKEIRIWAPLQNEENGTCYLDFDEKLRLVEVVAGAKCPLQKEAIRRALGDMAAHVEINRARASYDTFEMVKDEEWEKCTRESVRI